MLVVVERKGLEPYEVEAIAEYGFGWQFVQHCEGDDINILPFEGAYTIVL